MGATDRIGETSSVPNHATTKTQRRASSGNTTGGGEHRKFKAAFVPLDADEDEALTPNHFLLGSSSGEKPPGKFDERDLILRKSWRKSQHLADAFWHKWVKAYLPTLTRRTKWFAGTKTLEVGDVVLIVDGSLPRNSWPKGRIIATQPSADGTVRKATVQTARGIYDRPAVKIAVLDVRKC